MKQKAVIEKRSPTKFRAPSPEDACDCVTCLGCLAWPRVEHVRASKHGYWPEHWVIGCDTCTLSPVTGSTRALAVNEWNERNYRLGIAQ